MKSIKYTLISLFFLTRLYSQTTYNFSSNTASYVPITGTNIIGATTDEFVSNSIPIGFTFMYGGCNPTGYTNVKVSTNGFISLGNTLTGAIPNNNLNFTGQGPIIAPLWDDLKTDINGALLYVTTGSAGNLIFTVEWKSMNWNATSGGNVISFQVKLFQADNHIEFIYSQGGSNPVSASASIGLNGGSVSGDFYSLTNSSGTPNYNRGTETSSIATKPATGQRYIFTPSTISTNITGSTQVSCFGGNSGSINTNSTGGFGSLTYLWNNNATTPNVSGLTAGNYNITVSDQSGCSKSTSQTITEPTAITVNAGSDQNICIGSSANLSASASGGAPPFTYQWSPNTNLSNPNIFNPTANPTSTTNYLVTATDGNGCTGNDQVLVIVNTATANAGSDQTICSGQSTTIGSSNTAGYTYLWSPTNGLSSSSVSNPNLTLSSAGTYSYTVTATSGSGCSANDLVVITVNANPTTPNAGTDQSLCNATTASLSANSISIGTGAWSVVSGSATLVNSTSPTSSITGLTAGSTVELKWTASNSGCILTDNVIITNSALPTTANAGADIKVCNLTTANLSANNATTGSGIWSVVTGTGTITNPSSPNSSITGLTIGNSVTARWTISNGACASSTDDVVILAATLPNVTGSAAPYNICSGGTSNLNASASGGSGGGYIYNWSPSTGLSSSTVSNPSTSITASIIYTVNVTDGNNCSRNDTVTMNVKPLPTVNTVTNQSACNGTNFSPITFTGTAGASYNWTNTNSAIGLSSGGSGNINSFTGTNPNNSPISGSVSVTPTLNACSGTPKTFVLTVNPQVNVTGGATNSSYCSGTSTNPNTFTSNVGGATFNWTNSNTSIGLAASGTGNINSFAALNNTFNDVTSNLTVTASALGCNSSLSSFAITVKPKPTVDSLNNQSVCSGNTFSTITFTGNLPGTTYNWTNNNTAIGIGSTGTGNINSFTSSNNGTNNITATISVTPLASGCSGNTLNFDLTSKPIPVASSLPNQQYCSGETTINNSFTSNISGTTYNWFNNNTEIGLSSSGTGDILPFTASNNGTANSNITSTIVVTPTVNGCAGNNTSFTISVAAQVSVDAGVNKTICESEISYSLDGAFSLFYSSLAWASNGNGSFSPDNSTLNPSYTLGSNDIANGTVTLYLTASGLGNCLAQTDSIILSIDKLPSIANAGVDQVLCNDTIVFLSANIPSIYSNAIWSAASGSGVTSDYSQPNTLFTGLTKGSTSVFVWGVSNGLCPVSYDSVTVTVINGPVINLGADTTLCSGSNLTLTPTNNGSTLSWSTGETSPSITVSPNASSTYYLYASKNGCNKTDSITVNLSPAINITLINKSDSLNCFGDTTGFIDVNVSGGAQPLSSLQYLWSNNNNNLNLSNIPGGSYTLTVTDNLGCSKTSPSYTIYQPSPISVSLFPSGELNCVNSSVIITTSIFGGTSPFNYSWSTSANTSDITVVSPGTYELTVTDSNGCSVSKSTFVNQTNGITYTYQLSNENCNNADASLDIFASGGSGSLSITTEDTQNSFSLVNLRSGFYSFTITDNQGCILTDSILIEKQGLINLNVSAQISSAPLTDGIAYLYQTQDTGAYVIIDTISFNGNQTATFTQVNPAYNYIVGVAANNNIFPQAILTFNGDVYRWEQSPHLTGLCSGPDINTLIQIVNPIPQTGGATISGQVLDATDTSGSRRPGEPIRGIDIILEDNPGGQISMRTQTDSNGVYTFNNVPSRSYTIYVNIPGCDMISTYSLTVDSTSQVFEKNFYADSLAGTIDTTTTVAEAICNYNFAYSVIGGCTNEATYFINQSTNLSISNFSFSWDFENDGIIDDFTKGDNQITFNQSGTYTTKIKIQSNNSICKDSVLLTFNISTKPSVNAGNDISVCQNGSAQITLTTDASNFSWSSTNLLNNPTLLSTSVKTTNDTSVSLVLTVFNTSGCFNSDTIQITVNPLPEVSLNLNYDSACYGGGIITLSGENPTGGIFTATGLTGNLFDPVVAGLGTQTINYTVIDANNCISSISDQLEVVICTSIKEALAGRIKIYPNPGNGKIRLENPFNESISLNLYDISGKVMLSINIPALSYFDMNASEYPKGLYFVRLENGVSHYSTKLIIE